MNKRSRVFLLLAAASTAILAAALFFSCDTVNGILRQKKDEQAVEKYLHAFSADVQDQTRPETASETLVEMTVLETAKESAEPESTDDTSEAAEPTEIIDEHYFEQDGVTFTPDFAVGRLDCVLEIPSVSLKRGVYSGSQNEINYDLAIWLPTVASPDLKLGETHYAIYGHNHLVQNVSFNRLKYVKLGDLFTLTNEERTYTYLVTNIFSEWRTTGRSRFGSNLSIDPSLCYIFTCGRDDWLLDGRSTRYKDYIIEGTLQEEPPEGETIKTVEEPEETEAPKTLELTEEPETVPKEQANLYVRTGESIPEGVPVRVSLKDFSDRFIEGVGLSLLDEDGIEIKSWIQGSVPKELVLGEGTFVIAVTDIDKSLYEEPPGQEITIKESIVKIIEIGEEKSERAVSHTEIILGAAMLSGILAALFVTLFIVSVIREKTGNDRKEP